MSTNVADTQHVPRDNGPRPCQDVSLATLAERITRFGDRTALWELHDNRTPFRLRAGQSMAMVEYVATLRETAWALRLCGYDHAVTDGAYDLTIDKFANLPPNGHSQASRVPAGPDCRHYYGAFLDAFARWKRGNRIGSPILEECVAARILQRGVLKHFRLSCLEARRGANPARSRYVWRVNGGKICVWMPLSISGRKRGRWLEANVDNPCPGRPGERRRVQTVIDERLGVACQIPSNPDHRETHVHRPVDDPSAALVERECSVYGLARVVAEEKAATIDLQRPAVKALGRSRLKQLILRIFEGLGEGVYEEKRLAQAFGLSGATFSRFAGSRWRSHLSGKIPDLWANTAQTLAGHRQFVEAAVEAGVWNEVQRIMAGGQPTQATRDSDA